MSSRVLKAASVRVSTVVLDDTSAAERQAELEAAYRAGIDEGRRQAEADGIGAVPKLADAVKKATVKLAKDVEARQATDVRGVIDAAIDMAGWVLGREPALDADAVIARIDSALATLRPTGRLVISVAPSLVPAVTEWLEGRDAEVIGDASLQPGEARVQAGDAGADLTFAQAFRRLREALDATDEEETA